ncbi:histidine kinase [Nonomuraea sp. NPDC046802]|uniref:sensor histidine kinase n=1 Tax=Nonomuraea sp. NPDC046802 TaxID=3154919 RepID=UPI00340E4E3C
MALQVTTHGPVRLGGTVLITGVTALALGSMILLIRTLAQSAANHSSVASTRSELIGAAVAARERQRFARDLHDLISHGVSTIALKAEVASRADAADTASARRELREIVRLSGEVLTDIRRISHRHRRMSLDAELESVVSTLTGLGVEVTADISHEKLNPDTSTVLAIVLREGVTNLLRHGRGRRCEIRTRSLNDTVMMILVNDCVPASSGDGAADGSGLENLAARVAAVNGRFHAARSGDRFILGVEIPQEVFTGMSSD